MQFTHRSSGVSPLSELGPFALSFDAENMMQKDSGEKRIHAADE
jgi:hypothetical protein